MTEGLWEGEDGGQGWGVGIALGGLIIASPARTSCWKGAEWGQALPKKGSHRLVPGSRQGRGPGLASLEAFPLPGERGCSWLLAGAINLQAAGDLDAGHS